MTDGGDVFEVIALKFAQHHRGTRAEFFHGSGAAPSGDPAAIDYFVWVLRSAQHTIVVDVGYTPEVAVPRNRPDYYRSPSEAVRMLGIDPAEVPIVILSHLHYDHAGDSAPFRSARFWLQDAELRFWTGRHAHRREFARQVEPADILEMVRLSLAGRIRFVDGDAEVVPGVSVHRLGGHTPGTQAVRVQTASGPLVLACDASHLEANIRGDAPAAVFTDLPAVYDGFDRMIELAGGDPERVVPGHDPGLLDGIPAVPGLSGIAGIVA